uniref:Lipoxygenase domain-containing protein n=1 Tax=Knipowitschia caucasica TaxID=637954 RepID=A0AAV2L6E5_KNICA
MPNSPGSLKHPPPSKKGFATEATLLETLPDVGTTVHVMAVLYLLSKQSTDFVALGHYPEEYFSEEIPKRRIKEFQTDLEELHNFIEERSKKLQLPYVYLDPQKMENSVAL